jgi:FdhD protein
MSVPVPIRPVPRAVWRTNGAAAGERTLAEEVAVAFTYNRTAHAVMMATPADLEDYAVGFSLAEGIIERPQDIEEVEVVPSEHGIELRMWIGRDKGAVFHERRRYLAGPTGCGLCGIESLAEAMRPSPRVGSGRVFAAADIATAVASLPVGQTLNRQTRAVYYAA